MSLAGKIQALFADRKQTQPIFPMTKIKAVSDDNGKGLNAVLDDMTAYTRKVGNPYNLLDNSDFRNPVNQRKQTSYTSGYGIDRWTTALTVTVCDGFVRFENASTSPRVLYQRIPSERLKSGATYTFAYKKTDGTIRVLTAVCDADPSAYNDDNTRFYIGTNVGNGYGHMANNFLVGASIDMEWCALYEGEYTAETLPEYQPKGYGAELRECMRYCFVTNYNGTNYTTGMASITNTTTANCFIPYPVPMRANPTISDTSGSNWAIIVNGKKIIPDSIAIWYASNTNIGFRAKGTFDSADVNHTGVICSNAAPLVVFSADL